MTLFATGCAEQPDQKEILYLGTFSDEGMFLVEFDRDEQTFNQIQQVEDKEGPNFQWLHPNGEVLYSANNQSVDGYDDYGSAAAFAIDQETGELSLLNSQPSMGSGPAHVSVDPRGRFVYLSNYGGGNLAVYPIEDDGSLGEAVDVVQHEGSSVHDRQGSAYMHSAIPSPDGRFLYASDLGIDKVKIYAVNEETGELSPAETPYVEIEPGSGPRHFRIHPTGEFAYSVEELSSTITVLSLDSQTGALETIQRVDMVPEDFEDDSWAADIHISPDGQFVYASNRGHNSLAIYSVDQSTGELELVGHEPTRGDHPRNFAIDGHGDFVFMTNMNDDNLVLFERDQDTGLLTFTGVEMELPDPVCVTQFFIN